MANFVRLCCCVQIDNKDRVSSILSLTSLLTFYISRERTISPANFLYKTSLTMEIKKKNRTS